jgi:hypothetical protein
MFLAANSLYPIGVAWGSPIFAASRAGRRLPRVLEVRERSPRIPRLAISAQRLAGVRACGAFKVAETGR